MQKTVLFDITHIATAVEVAPLRMFGTENTLFLRLSCAKREKRFFFF